MCNPKSLKKLGGTSAQVARGISGVLYYSEAYISVCMHGWLDVETKKLSRDYLEEDGGLDFSSRGDPNIAVGSIEAALYHYSVQS